MNTHYENSSPETFPPSIPTAMTPQQPYIQQHDHDHMPTAYHPQRTPTSHHQPLTIPQLLHPTPAAAGANPNIPPRHQHRATPAASAHHDNIVLSPDTIPRLDEYEYEYGYEYGQDPRFLELQQELRCLLFTGAREGSVSGSGSYGDGGGVHGHMHEEKEKEKESPQLMRQIITSGKMVGYLKNYMAEVAPWLDMFDSARHFTIHLPILARHSAPLLYALLAVSARQIERKSPTTPSTTSASATATYDSLSLYQSSISLLKPLLVAKDPNVLASCVVLCCLEMMSVSCVGRRDWRRHLEGCAALFEAFGVNGGSGGLLGGVFWCYARMDLCLAMISDGSDTLVLPVSKWIPPNMSEREAAHMFRSSNNPDMYANYSVYISAKVCDLVCARTRYVEMGEFNEFGGGEKFAERWGEVWRECEAWAMNRPREIRPVETLQPSSSDSSNPFPEIFFAHWAAISSTQLYHTSCILLLDIKPPTATAAPTPSTPSSSSVHWHARQICGISMTNAHPGCLNNAIQPLWIAGKLLSHRTEHTLLMNLIRRIERMTGWGASWRIKDLREAWGYD